MSEPMLAAAVVDPRIGQIVQDRYRIVRKIGEGGMGAVYEGEHTVIKRKVAIKCLHAQYATNQEMVNRFHREAMAANAIRHPNIVEVTDMGRFDDGAVFMVLEFLEGKELAGVLKQSGAMPLSRVVYIISQVCDALSAAHEANIVHRDLKPDNIYLCPRGEDDPDFVKVLDFGIAKFREHGGQGVTRTGMTMGTPNYMAPEQAQASKDLDHRADIYSLGVILFHLITGVLPYDDESFPMLMVKVISYPAPRMRSVSPDIPPELDELVDRMLAKNPAMRPPSCKDVKAALAPFRTVHTRFAAGQAPQHTHVGHATPGHYSTPDPTHHPATGPLVGSAPQIHPPGSNPGMHSYGSNPQVHSYGSNPSAPAISPPRSGPPLALIGIGALVLLLGGGGAAAFAMGAFGGGASEDDTPPRVAPEAPPEAPPDPQETAAEETPEEPPIAAQEQPEPEPPPTVAQTVRVQISTVPSDAELFLDGERIANPFDGDLPQTSTPRRLEARREGYRTEVQDLSLRFGQRVTMRLSRGSGVNDTRAPRRGGGTRPSTPQTPVATPTTTPTTPTTAPRETPTTPATGTTNSSTQGRGFVDVPL